VMGDVDWIGLAQDRGRFHKMLGNYRVASQLGISRVVLSSMVLVSSVLNTSSIFRTKRFIRLGITGFLD
jgi:hypothetical protein